MSSASVSGTPTPLTLSVELPPDELHLLTRVRRWMRYRRDFLSLVSELNSLLHSERATGRLTLHYTQGRVAVAEFREESPIDSSDAE